jgi:2',3'-cyclic-nucleotide 2'-phosphodiesterase/3'-nucleotidase
MPLLALLAGLALAPADTVRLVVVATTDINGYVTDWDYLRNSPWPGGLARAATAIDSLRERFPGQVVLVDAGNALSGSPLAAFFGRATSRDQHPVIDAMNTIGYDAATPGDRDFDFGLEAFNRALGGSSFAWVSGNLRALPEDTLALRQYVVLQRNGVRVAVTGFTTPGAMVWNGDRLRGRLRVARIEPAVQPVLREMQQDADFSIVLSHSGLEGYASYDTTGIGGEDVSARIASGPLRPDLVIVGHSHQELLDSVIGGVHFVQPRAEGKGLAVVHVALLTRGGKLTPVAYHVVRISLEDVRSSPRVMRRLVEAHRAVLGWVSTVIGEAPRRLTLAAARVEEVPLLRFIQAVQRKASGAELSATSAPDLRAGIDEGEITIGEIFRLYPTEYTLRAVRVNGAGLRAYLEQSARYFFVDSMGRVATNRYVPPSQYDLVSGASYTLDLSRPAGSRVTRLDVRGKPVEPGDSFTLALSSSRQQGGGNFQALAGAPVVYDKGQGIRDLLIAEIQRRHQLTLTDSGPARWTLAPADYASRARALFVADGRPAAAADPGPQEPVLPTTPSRQELAARDSLVRARDVADSIAAAAIISLRLPAEPGAGKNLARLLADAYRNTLRTDLAIVATNEAGERLPAGGLTRAQLAAAAPGDEHLLTVRMTGADIEDLLENLVATVGPCCELSGAVVTYDPKSRSGDRVRRARLTNGGEFERKRSYTVALSSRLVSGDSLPLGAGDCRPDKGCRRPGLLSRWTVTRSDTSPAEALVDYLKRLRQPVTPPEDRRLVPNR